MTVNGSFPFGSEFQRASLRLMLEDDGFCALALRHFRPSYFESAAMGWVFTMIEQHHAAYQRPPSLLATYESLRQLDPLVAQQYQPTVDAIAQTPATDEDFIRDRVVDFVRRNLFVEGFENARRLYNRGDVDAAYDFWQRRSEEIQQINLGGADRSFFFDDFEARFKSRQAHGAAVHTHTFSTGIPDLDDVLDGGLSKGELGGWIAYQKTGKSMMLVWLAFWAVRANRVPVLVTVHEGGREYWENRLDAAFANTFVTAVSRGQLDRAAHRDLVEEYREMRQLLVIRGYTKDEGVWNATALDIAGELKELRTRWGFRPSMIVVDYADLLRARPGMGASSETEHQTHAVRDLKALTDQDRGYAIWTAFQAQRKNPKADVDDNFVVHAENVSDAAAKFRVPDFYGSINRTVEEKQTDRARLFAEDYRGGLGGRVIPVDTDYANGRFIRSILSPPPDRLGATTELPPTPTSLL